MDTNLEQRITALEKLLFETDQYRNQTGGTGEKSYKVYTALLTQSGENAPTAVVLENTIGEITWSRQSVGLYHATCSGCFTENKTFVMPYSTNYNTDELAGYEVLRSININTINVYTYIQGVASDNVMIGSGIGNIEIRVYP